MLNVKQINKNICKQIDSEKLPKNKKDLKILIRKLIHKELDGYFTSAEEIFEHFGINTKLIREESYKKFNEKRNYIKILENERINSKI